MCAPLRKKNSRHQKNERVFFAFNSFFLLTCGTSTKARISFTLGLSGGLTPYKYAAI
jgi:hypothetical protein